MPVSLYMSAPVVTLPLGAPLAEVQRTLDDQGISCVPLLDEEGRPAGVLSRTDLLRIGRFEARLARGKSLLDLPDKMAGEVMHAEVVSVAPDASVAEASRLMVKRRIHRVFVLDQGKLAGVLSTKDVLSAIRDKRLTTPIAEVMAAPAFLIQASAPVATATDRLGRAHISGLVVVDEDEHPIGTFTQTESLRARDLPPETPVEDVMSHAMLCLDARTPMHRAAAQAHATRARRVLAVEDRKVKGVLTGLDFAKATF
ncbi:MAG: CBS domain-containing protein [Byssovorax sp.]